jgi:uroporphyrin-III C-methyltransferase
MSGFVSLVGAGPGDPELLTLKAMRRLQEADLVLYDALVAPESLGFAYRAQRFFVGKRAGRPSIEQETINKLMIRAARRGKRVVRLKCGDPFVLGRGGEEGLALLDAGISFEVVPGLSSALSAPALSGIPVTHRGLSSGFLVLSGHSPAAYAPALESIAPGSITLVVLMGLAKRAELARLLLQRGWKAALPAAVCLSASTPRAQTWVGTLETLGAAELGDPDAPGILVVGEVVSLAGALGNMTVPAPVSSSAPSVVSSPAGSPGSRQQGVL